MAGAHKKQVMAGFWIQCGEYVLQYETCTCDLPAGGLQLGDADTATFWNKARMEAAMVDYSSLVITLPPDPDLYSGGQTEAVYYVNLSVTSSALFVSRTDAGYVYMCYMHEYE